MPAEAGNSAVSLGCYTQVDGWKLPQHPLMDPLSFDLFEGSALCFRHQE